MDQVGGQMGSGTGSERYGSDTDSGIPTDD